MLAEGTLVADRFRLLRPLGSGGMGSVWLARHVGLDVLCALKLIRPEAAASADIRSRFEREAKAAAQLRSAHVVGILDHGVWQGTPYIAMEYLEGEDLEQRLARVKRLAPAELVGIVFQVAKALSKAHGAGLVHRDLKPANIFLARDDEGEVAKVLDFGIAKDSLAAMAGGGTKTGSLLGTPYYMSPEQIQGTRGVDHRSDLWSLSVVVFQCLVGRVPFESEAFGDLLLRIMTWPLPVPSAVGVVPPAFDSWWRKAACREPDGRFQSARELAESLALALGVTTSALARSSAPDVAPSLAAPRRMTSTGGGTVAMGHSGPSTHVSLSLSGAAPPKKRGVSVAVAVTCAALAAAAAVTLYLRPRAVPGDAAPSAAAGPTVTASPPPVVSPAAAADAAPALAQPAVEASAAEAAPAAAADPDPPATAAATQPSSPRSVPPKQAPRRGTAADPTPIRPAAPPKSDVSDRTDYGF
jgi:serine/threonine protein kinase